MLLRVALLSVLLSVAFSGMVRRDATTAAKHVVAVKGNLMCGSVPAGDVSVKLYRVPHNAKGKEDANQVLDTSTSGPGGMFHVEGNTNGFPLNETTIDGVLSIYHGCDDDAKKVEKDGFRRVSISIPKEYVTLGAKAKKTFDIGTINLQIIYPGEKRIKPEKKN